MDKPHYGMKVGYSLAVCVSDICEGTARLLDVEKIVVEIVARTEWEWDFVLYWNCRSFWKGYPAQAREVVAELRASGRIEMPRLENPSYYPPSGVIWAPVGEDPNAVPSPAPRVGTMRWKA